MFYLTQIVVVWSLSCVWFFATPPGSSVHGISQARILEWVVISLSKGSSQTRDWTHASCVGKWIIYHWATKEAQPHVYKIMI